ncbi:MAG: cold shock domain-containing protein [Neisseriaceae bacterium]|nr:cold shock domain-containing protein [Neisseriaceae bacterium]
MQGKIVRWIEDRAFGFIQEPTTGVEIFAHISVFEIQNPPPKVGEMVSFETQFNDEKGRTEAANVVYLNRSPLKVVKNSGTKRNSVYANDEQVELKIMPLQNYRNDEEEEIKPYRDYRGLIRKIVIIILLAIAAFFIYQNRQQIKKIDLPEKPQIMNKTLKSCDEKDHCYSDKKWRLE